MHAQGVGIHRVVGNFPAGTLLHWFLSVERLSERVLERLGQIPTSGLSATPKAEQDEENQGLCHRNPMLIMKPCFPPSVA